MTYPQHCPLCGADYREAIRSRTPGGIVTEFAHATLRAEPGGTPDPREPARPGRLLTLRCARCGGEYAWDYFGGRRHDGSRDLAETSPAPAVTRP